MDPEAARGVDAMMEGLTLHRALDARWGAAGTDADGGAAPDPEVLLRRVAGLAD